VLVVVALFVEFGDAFFYFDEVLVVGVVLVAGE